MIPFRNGEIARRLMRRCYLLYYYPAGRLPNLRAVLVRGILPEDPGSNHRILIYPDGPRLWTAATLNWLCGRLPRTGGGCRGGKLKMSRAANW